MEQIGKPFPLADKLDHIELTLGEADRLLELARERISDGAASILLAREAVHEQARKQLGHVLRQQGIEGKCVSVEELEGMNLSDPAIRCLYWLAFGRDPATADWWEEWREMHSAHSVESRGRLLSQVDAARDCVRLAERALNYLHRDADKWLERRAAP